jgi:hypothetical protein
LSTWRCDHGGDTEPCGQGAKPPGNQPTRRQGDRGDGPLATPPGTVEPTSRAIAARTTDILTLRNGLITGVWVVSDGLGALLQPGALRLA